MEKRGLKTFSFILKNFKKPIDKSIKVWYNIYNKEREVNKMRVHYLVEWKGMYEDGRPYFDSRTFRLDEEEEVNTFVYHLSQRHSVVKIWTTICG
jgi:hypothetical protein